MIEVTTEQPVVQEVVKALPDQLTRQLLIVKGRSGLTLQDLNSAILRNLEVVGRPTDDPLTLVRTHENNIYYGADTQVLGIHEEVRKRRRIVVDGKSTEFVEATPHIRNIWTGTNVKLLTPEQAADTEYAGRSGLQWAAAGGPDPEMVVRADNGHYYPATRNDSVVHRPAIR